MRQRSCPCNEYSTTMLVCGVSILLWSECMSVLQDHITVLSIKTPHWLTLHKDSNSTLTLSFSTGTLMAWNTTVNR